MTTHRATQTFAGRSEEFDGSTLVRARLVPYGALIGLEPGGSGSDDSPPPGVTADQLVWAVAFSGGYTPGYGVVTPAPLDWGCMVIDEQTGAALGSLGGHGALPAALAAP